jgi:hypothetical protein
VNLESVENQEWMVCLAHKVKMETLDHKVSQARKGNQDEMEDQADQGNPVKQVTFVHLATLLSYIAKLQMSQLVRTAWLNYGAVTVCCTWKAVKELMVKI